MLDSQEALASKIKDAAKGIDDIRKALQGLGPAPLATDVGAVLLPVTCMNPLIPCAVLWSTNESVQSVALN